MSGCSEFPAQMSDGRYLSQWKSGAQIDAEKKAASGIASNFDYRAYLTRSADQIIASDQKAVCESCCLCPARYSSAPGNFGAPYLFDGCADSAKPPGYQTSDLKSSYLSRQELDARARTPVITQAELISKGFQRFN